MPCGEPKGRFGIDDPFTKPIPAQQSSRFCLQICHEDTRDDIEVATPAIAGEMRGDRLISANMNAL